MTKITFFNICEVDLDNYTITPSKHKYKGTDCYDCPLHKIHNLMGDYSFGEHPNCYDIFKKEFGKSCNEVHLQPKSKTYIKDTSIGISIEMNGKKNTYYGQ